MRTGDTITARATPAGQAIRAIVRVSGAGVRRALEAVGCACDGRERGVTREVLRLRGGALLPCLVMRFHGPESYTGEDCAEVCFCGNPIVVERVLDALLAQPDVRTAQAGEFTARAFLHGRLTLQQAEGVAAIIAARGDDELRVANEILSGARGERYRAWCEDIAGLLALLEAGIDFSDQEDVRPIEAGVLRERLSDLHRMMIEDAGATTGQSAESEEPLVVLCGRPNTGKSTLFNALLGRERAVASPMAGSTRDVIEERLDLSPAQPGAGCVRLCDLAGLEEEVSDDARAPSASQHRAREVLRSADLVLWCDPRGEFDARDSGAWALDQSRVVRVRTFADRGGATHGDEGGIAVCALDGWNLGELRRVIADRACVPEGGATMPRRHRDALRKCALHLREAIALLEDQPAGSFPRGAELIAASLRSGLDALGELVGPVSRDDVIGRVFSAFCVGK